MRLSRTDLVQADKNIIGQGRRYESAKNNSGRRDRDATQRTLGLLCSDQFADQALAIGIHAVVVPRKANADTFGKVLDTNQGTEAVGTSTGVMNLAKIIDAMN